MQKYIMCEFSYFDKDNKLQRLIYTGKDKEHIKGLTCNHCGKPIKTLAHTFIDEEGAEWIFGNECVKKVFGVGLVKSKI